MRSAYTFTKAESLTLKWYSETKSLSTSTPLSDLFPATTIFIPFLLKLFNSSAHFLTRLKVSGLLQS